MASAPIKHGSEAGYREELKTDSVCDRCRNGHRVFDRQYTKIGKSKGIKYGRFDVLDHLYRPGQARGAAAAAQARSEATARTRARQEPEPHTSPTASREPYSDGQEPGPAEASTGPSLGNRLSDAIGRIVGNNSGNPYVESDEAPDYIHASDADPEPNDNEGWSPVSDDNEYVITKAGMARIEDNLGTYLSVVGITFEMIDPYCGPILGENFENIVSKWTKVIARYPRAAKLFLSEEGGTIFTWIGALQATWPVLLAIYKHHLAGTVQVDKQGRVFEVHPSANGSGPTVDATTPPFAYTVD